MLFIQANRREFAGESSRIRITNSDVFCPYMVIRGHSAEWRHDVTSLAVFQANSLLNFPAQMKRGRDTLTGGSGDVNPQQMVFTVTQTGNDVTTIGALQMPIPRLPTKPGKNLVIELLEVEYYWHGGVAGAAGVTIDMAASVTTNPVVPANELELVQDVRKLSWIAQRTVDVTATGIVDIENRYTDDLTDRAGHGFLVATDRLYFNVFSTNTGQANTIVFSLMYRFKEVALVEYIGIVQSQQ